MSTEPQNYSNLSFLSEPAKAHGQKWLELLSHLVGQTGATGLELGSWMGESAEFFLDNILTGPGAHLWCIDHFKGSDEHHLAGIACDNLERETRKRLDRFGSKAQIFRGLTSDTMRTGLIRDMRFDFVYVDASHDGQNVLRDSVLAWELLKPGGILIWDDYEWTVMPDPMDCPKVGIDAFLTCYSRHLEVLHVGWQVAARRRK